MSIAANDSPTIALVIPGRNCAATLDRCLQSVVPLLSRSGRGDESPTDHNGRYDESSATGLVASSATPNNHRAGLVASSTTASPPAARLQEIIFVDDGSTDATAEIAARYPVRVIAGTGQGPGAARNLGWQATDADLVWFIDSDCVAESDALAKLLPHMSDPEVAGVGGSYANLYPDSLVATLIHEEIVARHRRMPLRVNFLGGFNVLYRRTALKTLNGYDELVTNGPGAAGAEDCDLSFRAVDSGMRLHFELKSRVGHYHPTSLWGYLRTQFRHGRFRASLFRRHRNKISGDSYAGLIDYVQPPVALASLAVIPLMAFGLLGGIAFGLLIGLLLIVQLPMAAAIAKTSCRLALIFVPFGFMRAYARGLGLTQGILLITRSDQQDCTPATESKSNQHGVAG
ncbi:Putative glycosyltransferase EpsH [Roseimaritima multifibrata]|uniref:Glycosyltransferase EpsH n=1 Tax=Roseimaritima multifibrata TaxID=1930274 RepID=A0A517MA13_9BACT|nr:glycosyltransferase [Roseimaritima multifibrata]QDS91725.1 Putative glycosyltransferase EpsH [Roseimaritima multifibrata]